MEFDYQPTAEERAQHYSAALDSVSYIKNEKPATISQKDWINGIESNVEHLKLMISKDYWQGEDMKPLIDAIAIGETVI
jgi:hypothetical protein